MKNKRDKFSAFEAEQIGDIVIRGAVNLFTACGAPNDFQVRRVSVKGAAFGKENTVIWSLARGFRVSEEFSTDQFIERFAEVVPK